MRLAVPVLLLGTLLGCEQNTTLSVNLIVPVDVMAAIAVEDYPQQVGFGTDMHTGATWAVCAPSDTEFSVIVEDTTTGCVQEPLEVRVVMGPFVPPSTGCVDERADPFSALSSGTITATGSTTAFSDASDVTCITREESVDVTVAVGGS